MGEDREIPPYTRSGRHASVAVVRRESIRGMQTDADSQEALGRRAILRGRRGFAISAVVLAVMVVLTAILLYAFWTERDPTEDGMIRAAWELSGATIGGGLVYLAMGGMERAKRRRQAGERLLLRAAKQRERAEGAE